MCPDAGGAGLGAEGRGVCGARVPYGVRGVGVRGLIGVYTCPGRPMYRVSGSYIQVLRVLCVGSWGPIYVGPEMLV